MSERIAHLLVKDKDAPTDDHLSFSIDQTARNARNQASAGSFEDEECVAGQALNDGVNRVLDVSDAFVSNKCAA